MCDTTSQRRIAPHCIDKTLQRDCVHVHKVLLERKVNSGLPTLGRAMAHLGNSASSYTCSVYLLSGACSGAIIVLLSLDFVWNVVRRATLFVQHPTKLSPPPQDHLVIAPPSLQFADIRPLALLPFIVSIEAFVWRRQCDCIAHAFLNKARCAPVDSAMH